MVETEEAEPEDIETVALEIEAARYLGWQPGVKVPDILIRWQRAQEHIPFTRPLRFLNLGIQGSGKSSLLEVLAIRHPKIIDLFGSSDCEGLCWCKPEFIELFNQLYQRDPDILLITGQGKDVASRWDTLKVSEVTLSDFEEHDIVTTVHLFYADETQYFDGLQKITSLLWEKRLWWQEIWFVLIREAANWVYARLKVVKDDATAKKDLVKAYREARHHGLSIGLDTLRWTSIDKEIRDLANYIFVKQVGNAGLPDDLRWLYRYWRTYCMMHLKAEVFGIATLKGAVGFGRFDYPPWHKEEKENILRSTEIEVKKADNPMPLDRRYAVADFEHAEMITKYVELKSTYAAGEALARNPQTVMNHIKRHNAAVKARGQCPKCFHAASDFSKDHIVVRGKNPSENQPN